MRAGNEQHSTWIRRKLERGFERQRAFALSGQPGHLMNTCMVILRQFSGHSMTSLTIPHTIMGV